VSVALSTIPVAVSLAALTVSVVPDNVSPVEAVKGAKAVALSSQNTILSAPGSAKAVIFVLVTSLTALLVGIVVSSAPRVVMIVLSEVLISLLVKLNTAISPSAIPVSFIAVTLVALASFVSA